MGMDHDRSHQRKEELEQGGGNEKHLLTGYTRSLRVHFTPTFADPGIDAKIQTRSAGSLVLLGRRLVISSIQSVDDLHDHRVGRVRLGDVLPIDAVSSRSHRSRSRLG